MPINLQMGDPGQVMNVAHAGALGAYNTQQRDERNRYALAYNQMAQQERMQAKSIYASLYQQEQSRIARQQEMMFQLAGNAAMSGLQQQQQLQQMEYGASLTSERDKALDLIAQQREARLSAAETKAADEESARQLKYQQDLMAAQDARTAGAVVPAFDSLVSATEAMLGSGEYTPETIQDFQAFKTRVKKADEGRATRSDTANAAIYTQLFDELQGKKFTPVQPPENVGKLASRELVMRNAHTKLFEPYDPSRAEGYDAENWETWKRVPGPDGKQTLEQLESNIRPTRKPVTVFPRDEYGMPVTGDDGSLTTVEIEPGQIKEMPNGGAWDYTGDKPEYIPPPQLTKDAIEIKRREIEHKIQNERAESIARIMKASDGELDWDAAEKKYDGDGGGGTNPGPSPTTPYEVRTVDDERRAQKQANATKAPVYIVNPATGRKGTVYPD